MTAPVPAVPCLAGRVAVVTGGASAFGAATSRLLAAHGAAVVVCNRDWAGIVPAIAAIRADGGRAIGVEADCAAFGGVEWLRWEVERRLGPADLLVAFAAGFEQTGPIGPWSRAGEPHDGARALVATFQTVKGFLSGMIERRRGTIVTPPGVATFSRHLAKGLAEDGVRIACVAPATVGAVDAVSARPDRFVGAMAAAVLSLATDDPIPPPPSRAEFVCPGGRAPYRTPAPSPHSRTPAVCRSRSSSPATAAGSDGQRWTPTPGNRARIHWNPDHTRAERA